MNVYAFVPALASLTNTRDPITDHTPLELFLGGLVILFFVWVGIAVWRNFRP